MSINFSKYIAIILQKYNYLIYTHFLLMLKSLHINQKHKL